jgi:hypothetical protein
MRGKTILTSAALLAVCAVPATATAQQDLRSPDAQDAAQHRGLYETDQAPYVLNRGYGSPDAADAARDLPPARTPAQTQPGPYTDSERRLVESPEVQQMLDRSRSEIRPVVEARAPSGGFDWGDAGIGAAGMLGLFSIAAGSVLMVTARRRRRGFRVAH